MADLVIRGRRVVAAEGVRPAAVHVAGGVIDRVAGCDAAFRVDPASLHHRHPVTPYAGRMLHGVVLETWLRGRMVHDRGRFAAPSGAPLLRGGDGR